MASKRLSIAQARVLNDLAKDGAALAPPLGCWYCEIGYHLGTPEAKQGDYVDVRTAEILIERGLVREEIMTQKAPLPVWRITEAGRAALDAYNARKEQ